MQKAVGGKVRIGAPQLLLHLHLRCPPHLFRITSTMTKPHSGKVLMFCTNRCNQPNGPANRAWQAVMSQTSVPTNCRTVV